jgi:hypothetical protein
MPCWQPQQQQQQRWFSNGGGKDGDDDSTDITSSPVTNTDYNVQDIMDSFVDTSYYAPPVSSQDDQYAHMTNEEL